jgi:hypothetical protein
VLARIDYHQRVPVVRRADFDGVDIAPADQLAEIGDGVAAAVRAGLTLLAVVGFYQASGGLATTDLPFPVAGALAIGVADGDDSNPIIAQERIDIIEALIAGADHTQGDLLAGSRPARQPEGARGNDGRKREAGRRRGGGLAQEVTSSGNRPGSVHRACPRGSLDRSGLIWAR